MPKSMKVDKKIWDDFRNGEKHALTNIYHQHVQLLYRYGLKFTNDKELLKDTIQDLFFDLISSRHKLGSTDNIKFYLMASLRRKLTRNLKKQGGIKNIERLKNIQPAIEYSIEHRLIEKEELSHNEERIQKALQTLSPKQREILFYRFTCDFEYEQICEMMSIKYDSARKQVFRALKSLKECLSNTDIFILFFSHNAFSLASR